MPAPLGTRRCEVPTPVTATHRAPTPPDAPCWLLQRTPRTSAKCSIVENAPAGSAGSRKMHRPAREFFGAGIWAHVSPCALRRAQWALERYIGGFGPTRPARAPRRRRPLPPAPPRPRAPRTLLKWQRYWRAGGGGARSPAPWRPQSGERRGDLEGLGEDSHVAGEDVRVLGEGSHVTGEGSHGVGEELHVVHRALARPPLTTRTSSATT